MFLAHGVLGQFDEIIFLGVAAIFLVIMAISWVVSRMNPPEFDEEDEFPETQDRFKLD